jgi:hypothetical protein
LEILDAPKPLGVCTWNALSSGGSTPDGFTVRVRVVDRFVKVDIGRNVLPPIIEQDRLDRSELEILDAPKPLGVCTWNALSSGGSTPDDYTASAVILDDTESS